MAEKTEKVEQKKVEDADKAIADQVQDKVDEETEQGFRGVEVDTTPNENYTVAGVTAGKPVPETDEEAAAAVGSRKFI